MDHLFYSDSISYIIMCSTKTEYKNKCQAGHLLHKQPITVIFWHNLGTDCQRVLRQQLPDYFCCVRIRIKKEEYCWRYEQNRTDVPGLCTYFSIPRLFTKRYILHLPGQKTWV